MTQWAVIAALFIGGLVGWRLSEYNALDKLNAAHEVAAKLELARLKSEASRQSLARQLEDQANAEPASNANCLPASRVQRLNKF